MSDNEFAKALATRQVTLNIVDPRRSQRISQADPEDVDEFAVAVEEAINDAIAPDRVVTVTVSWRPDRAARSAGRTGNGAQPAQVEPVDASIDGGACMYCGVKDDNLAFSVNSARFVHQNCVEQRLVTHPNDVGARALAQEMGVSLPPGAQ